MADVNSSVSMAPKGINTNAPTKLVIPDFAKNIDTKALGNKLKEMYDNAALVAKENTLAEELEKTNERIVSILEQGAQTMFEGMGAMIAAISTGQAGAGDVGKLLLGTLGGILSQLGKMAIQVGVGLIGIKAALKTLNPVLAIAAGVALVAIGSVFSSGASKLGSGIGGKTRSYASGYGAAFGPTLMQFGDHAGASRDNPEYVLRHDQVKSMLNRAADNAGGGGGGGFVAETRLRGSDLLVAIRRAETNAGQ